MKRLSRRLLKQVWAISIFTLVSAMAVYAQDMTHHHMTADPTMSMPDETITQDWAKERLAKSPRHREWVKVKNGNREVNSFIVYPETNKKATAVVVIHEIFGMTDWVQQLTDELAEAGYIAIAPDLLSGTGPNGGGNSTLGMGAFGSAGEGVGVDSASRMNWAYPSFLTFLLTLNSMWRLFSSQLRTESAFPLFDCAIVRIAN